MTTPYFSHVLPIPTDVQYYLLEEEWISGYHGSQCAYGETPQTLVPLPAAQPTHPKIAILDYGGCHHTLAQ
jgi:hypothetical protein